MVDLRRAKFDKRLPKNLFKVTFEDIDTIRWLYKIAHTTADFIASDEIKEIEIVEVTFKNGKTNTKDIAALQKASPHPTIYKADEKYYIVIAGETLINDKPFLADDVLNIEQRSSLLTDLWHDLTKEFLPIEQRLGESIEGTVTRYKALQTIRSVHLYVFYKKSRILNGTSLYLCKCLFGVADLCFTGT